MVAAPAADDILDAALKRADSRHWEQVRLADVAADLDCGLVDIHRHFRDKEAIVDAWWDRADAAMLANGDAARGDPAERAEALIMTWLSTFADYRKVAREMLHVRLEPGHLHIQLPTLTRTSRTVQWIREAAGMHAPLPWRAIDETGMTSLFVATVLRWLHEGDTDAARRMLQQGLRMRSGVMSDSSRNASRDSSDDPGGKSPGKS